MRNRVPHGAFERLELYEGKLSRTVLRGGDGGNAISLPDQERIETVLKDAGLRTITLYSSVDPRRREAWIEKHSDADVLITNPRLVQTGLDLVSFATVVFLEIEYSLYVLWQGAPRSAFV